MISVLLVVDALDELCTRWAVPKRPYSDAGKLKRKRVQPEPASTPTPTALLVPDTITFAIPIGTKRSVCTTLTSNLAKKKVKQKPPTPTPPAIHMGRAARDI